MRIRIIETPDELSSLAAAWNALADAMKTPLLRHEWFVCAARAFCPPGKLQIYVVEDEKGLAAIAPLVLIRAHGVDRLEILGAAVLQEPTGLLYRDAQALATLVRALHACRRPLYLTSLPAHSAELDLLVETRQSLTRYGGAHLSQCPWIPVVSGWDDFYKSISSSWRSTLRRSQRRAEEFGPVTYQIISATPENVDAYLTEMFHVEGQSWKRRTGSAVEVDDGLKAFFSCYSDVAAAEGLLRFAFLRIGEKAVASQLFLIFAGRLWVLKIGYDEAYARCSPGSLLMHHVIRHAFDERLEAVELLGGVEPWLGIWKPKLRDHIDYRSYPKRPAAALAHMRERFASFFSRLATLFKKQKDGRIPWRALATKITQRLGRHASQIRPNG